MILIGQIGEVTRRQAYLLFYPKQIFGCRILLSEIFQVLLKFLPGEEDAALYCSER